MKSSMLQAEVLKSELSAYQGDAALQRVLASAQNHSPLTGCHLASASPPKTLVACAPPRASASPHRSYDSHRTYTTADATLGLYGAHCGALDLLETPRAGSCAGSTRSGMASSPFLSASKRPEYEVESSGGVVSQVDSECSQFSAATPGVAASACYSTPEKTTRSGLGLGSPVASPVLRATAAAGMGLVSRVLGWLPLVLGQSPSAGGSLDRVDSSPSVGDAAEAAPVEQVDFMRFGF